MNTNIYSITPYDFVAVKNIVQPFKNLKLTQDSQLSTLVLQGHITTFTDLLILGLLV